MVKCPNAGQNTASWELPQEIWLHIFRFATSTQASCQETEVEYLPFRVIPSHNRDWFNIQATLDVKRNLVLVCKAWRVLAMEVMFETVRIRHSSEGLVKDVEDSSKELGVRGYGLWVRHIVIHPQILDFDPFNPIAIPNILKHCPRAEILVRPSICNAGNSPLCAARFDPGCHFPVLPSLKRIDWLIPNAGPGIVAPERLGILGGFFGQLLRNSPNLGYLAFYGGEAPCHPHHYHAPDSIALPSLTTLRLESRSKLLYHFLPQWSLPKLTQLILEPAHLPFVLKTLEAFGSQLRVIELLPFTFICPLHHVRQIFAQCPNLQELNFYIDLFPNPNLLTPHQNLRIVRLRLGPNLNLDQLIQFYVFAKSNLPTLEHVVIVGDWDATIALRSFTEGKGKPRWTFELYN